MVTRGADARRRRSGTVAHAAGGGRHGPTADSWPGAPRRRRAGPGPGGEFAHGLAAGIHHTTSGTPGPAALTEEDPDAETVATSYVVVAPPDRWRVVGRGYLAVSDGRRSWAGTSTLVTERDSERAAISDAGPIGSCLYPGPMLRNLSFTVPELADIEGRPCWP